MDDDEAKSLRTYARLTLALRDENEKTRTILAPQRNDVKELRKQLAHDMMSAGAMVTTWEGVHLRIDHSVSRRNVSSAHIDHVLSSVSSNPPPDDDAIARDIAQRLHVVRLKRTPYVKQVATIPPSLAAGGVVAAPRSIVQLWTEITQRDSKLKSDEKVCRQKTKQLRSELATAEESARSALKGKTQKMTIAGRGTFYLREKTRRASTRIHTREDINEIVNAFLKRFNPGTLRELLQTQTSFVARELIAEVQEFQQNRRGNAEATVHLALDFSTRPKPRA
jgi:nucleoid DNA-binding protein